MLKQYFDDLTSDLHTESERIRAFFATHRPSAGTNREDLVAKLLKAHLLPTVGIGTGLILSTSGELSNQSDIVLVDAQSNGPLHGSRPIPLWLKEAVYGVIEVKTQLSPTEIRDAVAKCVRLKTLPSSYADSLGRQKIEDTLFCIWTFHAPADLALVKANIGAALVGIAPENHPDFIVAPGSFLWRGGHYYDLSVNGQRGSPYWQQRLAAVEGDESKLVGGSEMMNLGPNVLAVFLYWLNSWLYAAGPRRPNLVNYYPSASWGTLV